VSPDQRGTKDNKEPIRQQPGTFLESLKKNTLREGGSIPAYTTEATVPQSDLSPVADVQHIHGMYIVMLVIPSG
jgi:glycine betaine/choline ABC-type transport system substrate-binding protein